MHPDPVMKFMYLNHRGVLSLRQVIRPQFFFGVTEYYPEEQWYVLALDLDRKAARTFAVKNIKSYEGTSHYAKPEGTTE